MAFKKKDTRHPVPPVKPAEPATRHGQFCQKLGCPCRLSTGQK